MFGKLGSVIVNVLLSSPPRERETESIVVVILATIKQSQAGRGISEVVNVKPVCKPLFLTPAPCVLRYVVKYIGLGGI